MARIRTIKPEFFTSPGTAAVDFPVRIFYEALWCAADDFGIGETNFNALLGLAFPDSDGFSAQDVRRFCADCAQHFGTIFYMVGGRHYYFIPSWDKHQKTERREDRRKFPPATHPDAMPDQRIYQCADSAPDMPRETGAESCETVAGTGEQGNRGTGEREQGNPPLVASRKRAAPRKRIDPDYMPPKDVIDAIRAETGANDEQLRYQHRKFIDHWRKTGKPMADWDACWRNWMRTAQERGELNTLGAMRPSKTDQGIRETQSLKALYPVPSPALEGLA